MDDRTARSPRESFDLAMARLRAGDPAAAERLCRQALQSHPDDANLHVLLGAALLQQGHPQAAEASLTRAIELAPTFPRAYEARAEALLAQGRWADSLSDLQRADGLAPGQPAILLKLSHALRQLRRWAEAEAALERLVQRVPGSFRGWMDLGLTQQQRDRLVEAERSFNRAAALEPLQAEPQVARGVVLALAGRHEEAVAAFRRALELDSVNADALAGLGHVLKTLGDADGAIAAYRACIAAHPDDGEAWWALADFKTFRFDDRDVATMRARLVSDELTPASHVGLLFALGTELDRRREFDAAFECFRRGNALRRGQERYDPERNRRLHDELREVFTRDLLAARAGHGHPDPAPIFIVGMPRSGSTLVEQILASHGQVDGTYELPELGQVARSTAIGREDGLRYPATLRHLDVAAWAGLGQRYLDLTRVHRGSATRFTDKMPNNYVHVGLLALILPNARIVNVRRHPLDTCLSCYMQLFAHGQSFSYDLRDLGEHYLQYRQLMDHWHSVLPGHVLDLQYEDLVADFEGQLRRLLDYCGLPWDDRCLAFHETRRVVRSASSEQVRRPLYGGASNRWQDYRQHLAPLIEVLAPLLAPGR